MKNITSIGIFTFITCMMVYFVAIGIKLVNAAEHIATEQSDKSSYIAKIVDKYVKHKN